MSEENQAILLSLNSEPARPFFSYFGGKWNTARKYPTPTHDRIVEPFAGAAGYSVRHNARHVELYDASETVIGVWQYLIHTSASEIMRLPVDISHVDETDVCQEARWLIGFWLNKAAVAPRKSPSAWMRDDRYARQFWGETIRRRVASQLSLIRHWTAEQCDYKDVPPGDATWFVDPPYEHASGLLYPARVNDFQALGEWCRELTGQVIVCEREGATWLPFKAVPWVTKSLSSSRGFKYSPEVVWTNESNEEAAA